METKNYICPRCGRTSAEPATCVHGERGELPYPMVVKGENPGVERQPARYDAPTDVVKAVAP